MASSTARPVIVVTGTSGAGKGTLERAILPRVPQLELAVSATTRERREGEREGREYYFVSNDEFQRRLDAGEFLEHVDFEWGQRVGTLWSEIGRIRSAGKAPLLDLETEGALAVKREMADCVTVFVKAPSFHELERLEQEDEFDYVVVNDDVSRAADELLGIVQRELETAGSMSAP